MQPKVPNEKKERLEQKKINFAYQLQISQTNNNFQSTNAITRFEKPNKLPTNKPNLVLH